MEIAVKKKPATASAVKLPGKTTVNLAQKESRKKNVLTIVIGVTAILLISGAVAKFGVIDQYARLDAAEAEYNATHVQYVQSQNAVAEYPQVEKRYRTYSRKWMEDAASDGLVTVDRVEVLNLMEKYLRSVGTVNSLSVSDTTMVVNMEDMTLSQISQMLSQVEAQPIVAAAALNVAATEDAKEDNAILSFTLTIQLQPEQKEAEQ